MKKEPRGIARVWPWTSVRSGGVPERSLGAALVTSRVKEEVRVCG